MPIPLTPELARAMLDVYERRLRDPRHTVYNSTVLEAALGAPDFLAPVPNWALRQAHRWRSDSDYLK